MPRWEGRIAKFIFQRSFPADCLLYSEHYQSACYKSRGHQSAGFSRFVVPVRHEKNRESHHRFGISKFRDYFHGCAYGLTLRRCIVDRTEKLSIRTQQEVLGGRFQWG